ncbi:MAG: phage tail tape measure protein, partial [Acidimicrobiales bacterium]
MSSFGGEFLPPVIAHLGANIAEFEAKMGAAKAELSGMEGRFSQLATVGKAAFLGLGTAALGVAVASVGMAAKFSDAMLLIHTQAGASTGELNKMTEAVLKLAPAVGFGPKALAEALFPIESIGLRGGKALDALKLAAEGAAVGHSDLIKTADALASVLGSGITGVHNATEAMGLLNAIVGQGKMHMEDLAGAMGSGLLSSAQTFGVSLQSVGAALDVMTNAGMPAEQAATRLRMSLALMAAPSKQAATILGDLGLSGSAAGEAMSAMGTLLAKAGVKTTQLANDLRQPDGIFVALTDLKTHLKAAGLTADEQAATISRAFGGGRMGAGIMSLMGNLNELQGKFVAIGQTAGDFPKAWQETQRQFSRQLHQLEAQLQVWAVQIGTVLIPIIEKFATTVADATKWLSQHKEVAIALAIAVGGPLVVAMGAYAVAAGTAAVATIAATAPILALAVGVGALVAATIYLWTHWNQVWT